MATRKNRPDLSGKRGQMKRQERRSNRARDAQRKLLLETLEDRRLLAVGPQLIGIQPNDGDLLPFDDPNHIRSTAPSELVFRFDENQVFTSNNLDGIQITRSKLDGVFTWASVQTDFNTGNAVTVDFKAAKLGEDQNGISLGFSKRDQGGAGLPTISVIGDRIDVSLNTNIGNESTAEQLIEALESNAEASALVRAEVVAGSADANIATPALSYSPLILGGAGDIVVNPGYIGVGDSPNEVIVRFSETLPDDLYRIDVYGEGLNAFRNSRGIAFGDLTEDNLDNGSDFAYQFELDLGAKVVSVIPQPVLRDADGDLSQARDQVLVYFNDDDLDPASAENPIFYQLIFTNDNAEVFDSDTSDGDTSDVVFNPVTVQYNAETDAALLTFAADLDQLPDPRNGGAAIGHGTYRLRVGTDEAASRNPTQLNVGNPGDSFDTAMDLAGNWDTGRVIIVNGNATAFQHGQTFTVTNEAGDITTYEFNDQGAGVTAGNEAVDIDTAAPTSAMGIANAIATAINNTTGFAVVATATNPASGVQITLAGDASIELGTSLTGLGLSTQGIILHESISVADEGIANYPLDLPGGNTEPGHRDISSAGDRHLSDFGADSQSGITTVFYNFRDHIGFIPGDTGQQPAYNNITEAQKSRAREIFEILSEKGGIQYVETPDFVTGAQNMLVATGDLRAIDPTLVPGPGGVIGLSGATAFGPAVIMDNAENWNDEFAGSWFQTAMHEIGHQMGLLHTYELPPNTLMGEDLGLTYGTTLEPDFPGNHDVVHLQHLHRPESRDIDLYEFDLHDSGLFTAEIIAERLRDFNQSSDLLDSALALYQVRVELNPATGEPVRDGNGQLVPILDANGVEIKDLIAQNDDYFTKDSYLELELRAGKYFIGVSASGNSQYDPAIENSGFNGKSEGAYDLRLNFRPSADRAITDADNPVDAFQPEIIPTAIDGDADGRPGGVYDFWFRVAAASGTELAGDPRTIFVDKSAPTGGDGTLSSPFNSIPAALNVDLNGLPLPSANPNAIQTGDILRIVGNPGDDNDIRTELDNRAYEMGFDDLGVSLSDGTFLEIPKDVTVMIDSGSIFKMRRSWIGAGSTSPSALKDRSAGELQILGAPVVVDPLGNVLPLTGSYDTATPLDNLDADAPERGVVHFTSYFDESLGLDTFSFATTPQPGDWGGLLVKRDIDNADRTRFSYEDNAIFLTHINHVDFQYGGGEVLIESVAQVIDPVEIVDGRPTVSYNVITRSRDAAIAASPDSFKESNFHSPEYQQEYQTSPFTVDYVRIGPDIHGNYIADNTTNGLTIRVETLTGEDTKELTVSARFDDTDIVHVLQENLAIDSNPGGPKMEINNEPDLSLVTLTPQTLTDGNLSAGTHRYRMVFVDKNGNEGLASTATISRTIGGAENAIRLAQLLTPTDDFVARRLYRSTNGGNYELIATVNQTDTEYVDKGITLNGDLDDSARKLRPRFDARLSIDPNVILKLDGAHVMVEPGAQFIAEGRDGHEVIITSLLDDRYGTAGTYDTSNDGYVGVSGVNTPQSGDWGGIYVAATSLASIDHAVIAYGGGVTKIEGTFAGFNTIEVQQGEARIANTLFEHNAAGFGGQAPASRYGRLFNEASVIFVRDAQPLIIDNTFRNNTDVDWSTNLAAISINVNAMDHQLKFDSGRSTGFADALIGYKDNHGPLIVGNMMSNNEINGLMIRGEVLTTQSIWDDTDIAHVLADRIYIPDFHTYGGLRLQSAPNASLVVKMAGADAGFEATGRPIEINDRIGGHVQILGQPKSPVILTSLRDDTVGAGIQPNGDPLVDTNNDGTVAPVTTSSTRTNITLNFGPAMAANPNAMATAQRAADYWGSLLQDPVDIAFDIDFATLSGGTIGTMSSTTAVLDYDTVLGAMVADATLSETIVGSIPDSGSVSVTGGTANDTIAITRANALAIGITQGLPSPTSQYGGGIIDGTMQISDSFDNANAAFYDTALHEIGHALGFISAVGGSGNVSLTTLDLFRIAPGSSPTFGTTPRVIDQNAEHVFYDGGEFNPTGITTIAGLLVGEIPLTNGGDGYQPSHWKHRGLINNIFLGTMDPIINPGADPAITANDIRALGLMGWDVEIAGLAGPAQPGDWDTILLNRYSHDRNVDVAVEFEDRSVNAPGTNANALSAQFLGELAPNEKSGDENRRLGFEVHGFLSNPQDLDVYSFSGVAGTEVWVDFDKTTYAFDPIVELIDGNGTVLVRSINTLEENDGTLSLYEDSSVPNSAFTMQKVQPYNGKDFWAVNPRDPGLRLVLPGPADTRNTYHLRVRSNTKPADIHKLDAGITSGAYQMQLRLRELDEVAGSVIRYANISYADTGITVYGQPVHSPLSGENYEIEVANGSNDARGGAQQLGNVMATDRGVLSVAGRLVPNQNGADTDWYTFSVDAQNTQSTLSSPWAWPVVIDLDYADGLSRANTVVSIFDSSGTLILHSTDSNVQEDRPEPLAESQVEDLNRGSVGTGDPFLGPVLLPPGQYFVAVTSQGRGPSALGAASTRVEPVNSLIRVAEDHVDVLNVSTAEDPHLPGRLFDGNSIVPWNLADVSLYVMREDPSGILRSEMLTVNPYTGETVVDFYSPARGNTARVNFDVGDIVRQRDGTVHSFSLNLDENNPCAPRDDVNRFIELDPGFGTGTDLGWDEIETYQEDPANPGDAVRAHRCNNADHGYGVNFNAIYAGGVPANTPALERLLAVGNRGDFGFNLQNGVDWLQNIMFEFDPATGEARHIGNDEDRDPKKEKSWTNAWPVGRVITGPELGGVDATDVDLNGRLLDQLNDGDTFTIDDGFSQTTFEFDFGPQVRQNIDKRIGETMRDGYFFVLDPNDEIDDDELLYQFDTGAVINFFAGGQVVKDGTIVSINDDAGATFSYEFDSDPDPGVLDDPTATRIPFGAGTSALKLAGDLAAAINGTNNFTVTAEAVVSRVTLTNDLAITVTHVSGDVDGVRVEGSTGEAPVVEVKDVAGLTDGDTFSVITLPGNIQHIFEFDTDGAVSGSNIAVPFNVADTPEQVAQAIELAVNNNFDTTGLLGWAGGPRVSINGANVQEGSISTVPAVMEFESVEPPIQVEENSTTEEVAIATVNQVDISPLFEPSYFVDQQVPVQVTARIGFLGAEVGDFRGVRVPVWQSMNTFGGVLDPTHIPVELQVWDEAADFPDPMDPTFTNILDGIATKSARVINANMDTVTAQAIGDTVVVTDGTIVLPPNSPLTATGQGPGGNVTGLANVNGQIYGVSDEGGLYEIDMILSERTGGHPSLMSVTTQYVATSAADLHGIQFQGLVAGPENVEGGQYSDMLFGIDTNGTVYAFDTDGVLQPIFLDGVTHVETGITRVRGLMFSNLDSNLFHVTPSNRYNISANDMDVRFGLAANVGDTITIDERQFEVGHGITSIYDGTRASDTDFNQSFHFGRGNVGGTARSYDFIGGAHGSIISNEFSLRGFAAEDKPTLYFTYWSQTDGAQDRDTFRVWATDNNSDWSLLATNNDGAIQDDSTWRQVRASLAGFAGVDNLRLRVDFDSAGDRNTGQFYDGELNNTGTELVAIDGIHIRDGQTYEIDSQVFEFESGFTIVAPSARALQDGDNFTVENAAGADVTFEFDHGGGVTTGNTAILLDDTDSGSDVAAKIEQALGFSGLGIVTHRNDERVNLEVTFDGTNDAVAVTNNTAVASFVEGEYGRNLDPITGLPNDLNAVVFSHEDMTSVQIADSMNSTMEANFYTPILVVEGAASYTDGDTFVLNDSINDPVTFEIEKGFILTLPAAGSTDIIDGDTLVFTDGTDTYTVEFDNDGTTTAGNSVVTVAASGEAMINVSNRLRDQINNDVAGGGAAANLGLQATVVTGGRVQIFANDDVTVTAPVPTNFTLDPTSAPGVGVDGFGNGHVPVRILDSGTFRASDVADAVRDAINGTALPLDITAAIVAGSDRRVQITHDNALNALITFTDNTGAITLEQTVAEFSEFDFDAIKQFRDTFWMVGHTVDDPGPLGWEADKLCSDRRWGFCNEDSLPEDLFHRPFGYQDNRHEGIYLDDFVIGFAERGEIITNAPANDGIGGSPSGISTGTYQLEVRRSSVYVAEGTSLLTRSFDTNERHATGYSITAPEGAEIHDGETFDLTDGIDYVRFEFDDTELNDGVQSGNFRIPFTTQQDDFEVAQSIRDAINHSSVQATLDVVSATWDGKEGVRFPDATDIDLFPDLRNGPLNTSNVVDLFGEVYVLTNSGIFGANNFDRPHTIAAEINDTMLTATSTGITGFNSPRFISTGYIGDNADYPLQPGHDVDLFEFSLDPGEQISVSIEAQQLGTTLDAVATIFDSSGNFISQVNDTIGTDPSFTFTSPAAATDTFYLGISGHPVSGALSGTGTEYDPAVYGSAVEGDTGSYRVELSFGITVDTTFTIFDNPNDFDKLKMFGDQNHFRDQGQLIIDSNRIAHSRGFGIEVDAGSRDEAEGNQPHPGGVRHLDEINNDRLVPGVVVSNNLITFGGSGGIHYSGDSNLPGQPLSAIPYGRIINNTVYGNGAGDTGILIDQFASPTVLNNIVANTNTGINIDASSLSSGTVLGGSLYQGNNTNTNYSSEDFAISVSVNDPLFVDPSVGIENFYLAPSTNVLPNRAIDSSISSLEDRFDHELVKEPMGIPSSPILAPERDVTGQLRVDDPAVEPPNGLGANVYIDRGAMDRSDFSGPSASLIQPKDNDSENIDLNRGMTIVHVGPNDVVGSFQIRLFDGLEPTDPNEGVGISDGSVTTDAVIVRRNGELLVDGIDYSYSYNSTSDTIRLTPLSGIWTPDRLYTVELINRDHWRLEADSGFNIADGSMFSVTDSTGKTADFEFERGYTIVIPKTYEITVPPEGGGLGGITDGEFFTVRRGNEPPVTFEFDRDGDYVNSRVPITFEVNEEADSIAQKVRDALENIDLDFNPVFLGEGKVHVGSNATHNVDVSLTRLTIDGIPGGVADGDYFSVDDGSQMLIFEFEDTDIDDGIQQGDIQIDFNTGHTNDDLADILVSAITTADLGLTPRNLGDGLVHIGGTVNHELITSNSNLSQFGTPSVRHEFGLRIPTRAGQIFNVLDAETFVLRKGAGVPVTFELNNLNEDSDYTLGNIKIDFTNTTSVEQLASSIVIAIQGAGLDLDPQIVAGTSIIDLGSDGTHTLNTANTNIQQVGLPGVDGANPVFVLPVEEFDATQTAVAIRNAFESDELLTGVSIRQAGGASLIVNGATVVADQSGEFLVDEFGRLTPYQLFEIEDLATNPLKANQLSGETMFTIQLDRVDYDLGDAPDGVGVAPQNSYPTLTGHNAAIHMATATGPILGQRRDRDIEGQSIAIRMPAGADLTDGEQFSITAGTRTVVFEFDNDGTTTAETTVITFTAGTTADALAQSVSDAVNTSGIGANPRNIGGGIVLFETNQEFDLSAADSLTEVLAIGDDLDGNNYVVDTSSVTDVSTSVGATPLSIVVAANQAIAQGETFTIANGSTVHTFEFDNDLLAVGVTDGNIRVPFTPGASEDVVAQSIADAIVNADLPLNLNPIVQSGGIVALDGDDEDGVNGVDGAAIKPLNAFTTTEIEVSASGDGLLDAWVDFNRDGDWDDLGEQIFASQQVVAGVNSLSFNTPMEPASKPGETFARFRISSEGGLASTGLAKDGEVEDYLFTIVPGHPPEAKNDPVTGALGYETNEDTALPTGGNNPSVLTNDLDADGNDFRVNDFDAFSAFGAQVAVDTGFKIADGAGAGTFAYDPTFDDPNDAVENQIQELAEGDIVTDTFSYSLIEADADPPGDPGSAHEFESQTRAIVAITLTGVNDIPTSEDINLAVNEDGQAITVAFVGDDVDRDDDVDSLTYTFTSGVPLAEGTVTNNQDSDPDDDTFTFNPNAQNDFQWLAQGETTIVTFDYTATDRHDGVSAASTVTVTVTGENDLPAAADDSYSVSQDSTLNTNAASGVIDHDDGDGVVDTDPDTSDVLLVTQVDGTDLVAGQATITTAKGAQLTIFADGSFDYDPRGSATLLALNDGESENDSFEYKIEDPHGQGSLAIVTITVNGVNNAPVANPDSYTVDQDKTLVAPLLDPALDGILDNDTDDDAGDSISVSQVQGTALTAGTITIGTDKNATVTITSDGNMTYDPTTVFDSAVAFDLPDIDRGDSDSDTFTYTIQDVDGATAQTTVSISVIGVNKHPVAVDDLYNDVSITENTATIIDTASGLLANDSDPESDQIEISGINGTTSRIGVSQFGAAVNVTTSGRVIYDPTQRDAETGDFLSPIIQAIDPGNSLVDTFTYTIVDYIDDGNGGKIYQGGTSEATVQIEVQGVNDEPVTVNDVVRMERNTVANPRTLSIDVTANDTDADNYVDENSGSPISGSSTVTIVGDPANGTAEVIGLNIVYTPDVDFSGGEVISYTVTDEHGAESNVSQVIIEVNDNPVAVNDILTAYQDIQNTPTDIKVLENDTDSDGVIDATTVVIVDSPTDGVIESIESDGTVVYRPNDDFIGEDEFTYQFQDDDGDWSNVATVTIDVIDDPYPWQNKANPLDVNWDGDVSPIDALLIITYMNDNPDDRMLPIPTSDNKPPPFLDPNGDNSVDPVDALMIINWLNANANGEGEDGPEGEYFAPVVVQATAPQVIYTDAILDTPNNVSVSERSDMESVIESATSEALDAFDNRYRSAVVSDLRAQRAAGLTTVRGELLEDLLDDIAGDISDNHDDGLGLDDWLT